MSDSSDETVARYSGPWDAQAVATFLAEAAVPFRIAVNHPGGFPVIVSLWYLFAGGRFLLATQHQARVVQRIRDDPRVGFEVACNEPPYRGVRGHGRARILETPGVPNTVLARLIDRYMGGSDSGFAQWLLSRAESEVLIEVTPQRFSSWDYRRRMQSAL